MNSLLSGLYPEAANSSVTVRSTVITSIIVMHYSGVARNLIGYGGGGVAKQVVRRLIWGRVMKLPEVKC